MKRTITALAAAALMLLAAAPSLAQGENDDVKLSRQETRDAARQAKAAGKLLRKEGYKPFDLGDVSDALERYYLKLGQGAPHIVGTSGPCMSENLAKLSAITNAANEWAVLQGGTIRGRIVSSASSLSGSQVDNLVASFERMVEKDISGELIPYVCVYKERGGRFTARAYCVIDAEAASMARRKALELALGEQALLEQYGSMVSDWISEGRWKESEMQ